MIIILKIFAKKPAKNVRITNYLNSSQNKHIFSGITKSHFNYCPLIWLFSSRKANNLFNKIHERFIQIVSRNNESNFENLLLKIICQRNLLVLIIEVCKIINGYAPPIMGKFFAFGENTHHLRNFQLILNKNNKAWIYGLETISCRTSLLYANLPEECKFPNSLREFKSKMKSCKSDVWIRSLCWPFFQNLGFIKIPLKKVKDFVLKILDKHS